MGSELRTHEAKQAAIEEAARNEIWQKEHAARLQTIKESREQAEILERRAAHTQLRSSTLNRVQNALARFHEGLEDWKSQKVDVVSHKQPSKTRKRPLHPLPHIHVSRSGSISINSPGRPTETITNLHPAIAEATSVSPSFDEPRIHDQDRSIDRLEAQVHEKLARMLQSANERPYDAAFVPQASANVEASPSWTEGTEESGPATELRNRAAALRAYADREERQIALQDSANTRDFPTAYKTHGPATRAVDAKTSRSNLRSAVASYVNFRHKSQPKGREAHPAMRRFRSAVQHLD